MPADPFDPNAFRALGHRFVDELADHLAATGRRDGRVLAWQEPGEKLGSVAPLDGRGGADPVLLLARLLAESNRLHDPRFVGHQVCPSQPMLALFEAANALLNNGMAVYEMGPLQTAMELRAVAWMTRQLGFPDGAGGLLTSGGSLGNLTALLAARQRASGGAAWHDGGDRFCVLASAPAHYCIDRAARILGWGEGGVVTVPVDDRFRMRSDAVPQCLHAARANGRTPVALVASAGTTATGAFDPLAELADVCAAHGLWLHVDAAHGASFLLAPSVRMRLRGIERADSVVWDAHKMLQVPALVTGVLFRDGRDAFAAFAQQASYLFEGRGDDEWYNLGHRTLECTKRGLGVLLYALLAVRGEAPIAADLEHLAALARAFADRIDSAPDFELAVPPECNIVCFRHTPGGVDLDQHNRAARRRLMRSGPCYVVQTQLPQGLFLRTTLVNPRTTLADLDAVLDALRGAH